MIAKEGPGEGVGSDIFGWVIAAGMDAGDFDEDSLDEIAAWHWTTGLRIIEAAG